MSKIILDSDGIIKLQKAGLLETFCKTYDCLIPEAVYQESVTRGKEELYEDAFEIEETVETNVEVKQPGESQSFKETLKKGAHVSLGQGEKEALSLYFEQRAAAIVSDDRAFLNLLRQYNKETEGKNVAFLTPANAIVALERKGAIYKEEAKEGLIKIKAIIRQSVYESAIEDLQNGGD
jgi:predicted nucleic acid-binding protein